MDWVGTLCAVVGAGTLATGFARLVWRLDESAKKDRTRGEAGYGRSAKKGAQ